MTVTANALDGLLAIRDGHSTARWNFGYAVGTQVGAPGGIGSPSRVSYSFLNTLPGYTYPDAVGNFQPLDEATLGMRSAALAAIANIQDIARISFTPAASGSLGTITFGMDAQSSTQAGYAYYPAYQYSYDTSNTITAAAAQSSAGDIWINDAIVWKAADFQPGGQGLQTLVHELGHAIGLKHSFEGANVLDATHDTNAFTVMSYTEAPQAVIIDSVGNGSYTYHDLAPSGMMLGDIRALQYLYGANTATRTGNDTYRWTDHQAFLTTIWDAGGSDMIDCSNQTLACSINLNAGTYSSIGIRQSASELMLSQPGALTYADVTNTFGGTVAGNLYNGRDNLAIADNVVIETALGGRAADTLVGNQTANVLRGNGGADVLTGGGGSDTFDFVTAADSTAAARDVITDFQSGDLLQFERMGGITVRAGNYAFSGTVDDTVAAIRNDAALNNAVVCFSDGSSDFVYIKGAGTGINFDGSLVELANTTRLLGTGDFRFSALTALAASPTLTTTQIATLSLSDLANFTPTDIALLTSAQLRALTTASIAGLGTAQIAALTSSHMAALSTAQLVALTTDQIVALGTGQVAALSTAEISALGTAQIAALETADIAALAAAQVRALGTAQIAAITTEQIRALKTAQIAVLNSTQIVALSTDQAQMLSSRQVAALTTAAVRALETADLAALTTTAITALGTANIAALTTAQVAALTTAQIEAFATSQIAALGSADIAALHAGQLQSFATADIAALRTLQIRAFTTAQIAALTTDHVLALTSTQIAAFSTAQIAALTTDQAQVLTTRQVTAFTSTAVRALETADLAALSTTAVRAFGTAALAALTSVQIAALTTDQILALTTRQIAALGTTQIVALTTDQAQILTTSQIAMLSTAAVRAMATDDLAMLTTAAIAALRTGQIAALTTAQVAALTTLDIAALSSAQFQAFSSADIAALTTDQLQSLEAPDLTALRTLQIRALNTLQIAALTTDQIHALSTVQIAALSSAQVIALTTDQMQVLSSRQITAFTTTDIRVLETADLQALSSSAIAAMSTLQMRTLSTGQFAALTTDQVAALRSAQIAALTTAQIASLTTDQAQALSSAQVAALTTTEIRALEVADLAALSTDAIAGLSRIDIATLTTRQIQALTTSEMLALTTTQVHALTTTQLHAITTTDIVALTTTQLAALSMDHVNVLTSTQVQALANDPDRIGTLIGVVTPLALDLNGDGVQTVGIGAGVRFDLTASGHTAPVGWIAPSDGLLALDRNHDGKITNGSELFGSATLLADGTRARNGFQALADLDTNHDGVIDSQDKLFKELRVWIDANQDGVSQPGELHTLDALGIVALNLHPTQVSVFQSGNWIGLDSSYATTDGKLHALADVWLQINGQNQRVDLATLDPAHIAPGALARLDLSGNGGNGDVLSLSAHDVQVFGQKDLVVNAQTGSDHVQMIIQGDANDVVRLIDTSGGHWTDGGTTRVAGQDYHILNHGHEQVLVGVKVHEVTV